MNKITITLDSSNEDLAQLLSLKMARWCAKKGATPFVQAYLKDRPRRSKKVNVRISDATVSASDKKVLQNLLSGSVITFIKKVKSK